MQRLFTPLARPLIALAIAAAALFLTAPAAQAQGSAVTECTAGAMAPCVARAEAMKARGQYRAAADYLEPACRRGIRDACVNLWPLLLESRYGIRDGARFYAVYDQACAAGEVDACGDAALVAAGFSSELPNGEFRDIRRVRRYGEPGCRGNDLEACYAMMRLYADEDSPYRNPDQGVIYARKTCDLGEPSACAIGSNLIVDMPNSVFAQRSAEVVYLSQKACDAGARDFCDSLPNLRNLAGRVAQFGAADAYHMFIVDQGLDVDNWGGSVAYAVNEARSRAGTRYALGRVSQLGRMGYVAQNDLYAIEHFYGGEPAGQIARTELARRQRLDEQARRRAEAERRRAAQSSGPWVGSGSSRSGGYRPPPRSGVVVCTTYQGYGGGTVCKEE
ncbi:sel1 repeat family protein [Stakelama tenebrarum]|uniref:Sel1 repeat family protein n=1 Tax=Stakelama tenebrarum TaxID=2711215 RepID=A0A6G6Y8S9_9SPHN|nr:sel1 repeat family protein [Sphingosinithalassobacter tenebrarum]QIG80976.1 sel1 repeat family protein [Sphingosinithalassobacter tenebrarum]